MWKCVFGSREGRERKNDGAVVVVVEVGIIPAVGRVMMALVVEEAVAAVDIIGK